MRIVFDHLSAANCWGYPTNVGRNEWNANEAEDGSRPHLLLRWLR
jgi:hypothetical protein